MCMNMSGKKLISLRAGEGRRHLWPDDDDGRPGNKINESHDALTRKHTNGDVNERQHSIRFFCFWKSVNATWPAAPIGFFKLTHRIGWIRSPNEMWCLDNCRDRWIRSTVQLVGRKFPVDAPFWREIQAQIEMLVPKSISLRYGYLPYVSLSSEAFRDPANESIGWHWPCWSVHVRVCWFTDEPISIFSSKFY